MKKQNSFFLLILILFLINVHLCQAARVTGDQIILYTFKEGSGTTVNDVSGVAPSLNLTIASEAAISWIPGGGLAVDSSTIIESGVAATKVIDAVKIGNEMTFEAWIKPANTTQGGPARIVTVSLNPSLRNFTLAQQNDTYDVRLRTTSTSANGMPSVSTPAGSLTTNLTHVVYTREASGIVRIYIDGNEVANDTIGGDCSNWDDSYNLALANELSNDRTWLGEIYLVAIYDRALTQPEVDQNFAEGAILECNIDADCDDSNTCTDDTCVDYECQYTNNVNVCDDGLFCNGNDTCSVGSCSVHAGNPCPETECNTCQEATDSCFDPVGTVCADDGNGCTDDQCDGSGACNHPNNNNPCDDGLFCNGSDLCGGGSCSFHTGNPCPETECNTCQEAADSCLDPAGTVCTDDGNSCTDDQCDGAGSCIHPNNNDPCDDGLFCNGNDTCSGGSCSVHAGNPCPETECNTCQEGIDSCFDTMGTACTGDGNGCTDDECNGSGTCIHPSNNAPCDDGLFCNGLDICSGGSCSFHTGNPCPETECNTCQEATDSCFDPAGTACTDDGNICTDDECNGTGACGHPNNTDPCDDGVYCNGTDTCGGGSCSIHTGDPCPGTECNTCQEATDSCFDPAGTACTDDGNICTDDECNGTGVCGHPNNTAPCDDSIACTESDTCSGGACGGTPNNNLCSDGNICTDDACIAGVGCSNPSNANPCDDGRYCNGTDTCGGGICSIHTGDPCADDKEFCTGVEFCDESDDICRISGDPCEQLLCDESDDYCLDSRVSLIVMDSYDNPGIIKISLKNLEDEISLVQFDLCDPEGHSWLKINQDSCTLTDRVPQGLGSGCTIVDSESNHECLTVALSMETGDFIHLGSGPIIELSYLLSPAPLFGEVADLIPINIDIRDISDTKLTITPRPGRFGFKCQEDEDCRDYNECTNDICNNGTCENEEIDGCQPTMPCIISIEPEMASLVSEQSLNFTLNETGDCRESQYEWSIQSDIGGTIDQNADYIAGINVDCSQGAVETIKVTDSVNQTTAEADITVTCDRIKEVINISNPLWILSPNAIYSSHWLPLSRLLMIFAEQGEFDTTSSLAFEPVGTITTLLNLGRGNIMIALVLVEPNAQEGPYRASVTTGSHMVTKKDALMLHMVPWVLDEESNY